MYNPRVALDIKVVQQHKSCLVVWHGTIWAVNGLLTV